MSDSARPHRWQPTRLRRPWDSPGKNTGVGCHFLLQCTKVKSESEVAQSCPTLRDPMDCSPPGSSVHGIFQARVLEWGAIAFSEIHLEPVNIPNKVVGMLMILWEIAVDSGEGLILFSPRGTHPPLHSASFNLTLHKTHIKRLLVSKMFTEMNLSSLNSY